MKACPSSKFCVIFAHVPQLKISLLNLRYASMLTRLIPVKRESAVFPSHACCELTDALHDSVHLVAVGNGRESRKMAETGGVANYRRFEPSFSL